MILLDSLMFEKLKPFFGGNSWFFCHDRLSELVDLVIWYLFSLLLMPPEGFPVEVKVEWSGWGRVLSLLFLCFEIRNLSCGMQKKASYFLKKKKRKSQSTFGVIILFYTVVEEFKVRATNLPSCYQNSTEKK